MTTATQGKPIDNSGIHNYLAMKRFRSECTCCITCEGECYYIVNGHNLSENEFNEMFPTGFVTINKKGKRIGSSQQIY